MDMIEQQSLLLAEEFHNTKDIKTQREIVLKFLNNAECKDGFAMPPFPLGHKWLNTQPLTLDDIASKLVLLDFFTYCCINCIHMMPFVHKMESLHSIEDGFVVVGIHSAKFPNEKDENNINHALQRYNLTHPVVNDSDLQLWEGLNIKCWPTFVLLSPNGNVLLSLPGEAHADVIEVVIVEALKYYKDKLSSHVLCSGMGDVVDSIPVSTSTHQTTIELQFPAKLSIDNLGRRLAIADTGNHRVIICSLNGHVIHIIGGSKAGRKDGNFNECLFNSPHGVTWHASNSVYVADCANHLIRKIDLTVWRVVTIAGTGEHGHDLEGGKQGTEQAICSPWDLQVAGSPRFPQNQSILYIAMSGSHQIWTLFLQDADWQKGSEYKMVTCLRFVGSGIEENRNNSYPHKAGLAQPSGLTVDVENHKMYIADSESSTIRQINLRNGNVGGLVGGHFDPTNLFAFGDEDGKTRDAKLQHPLGVAWDRKRSRLYVADSYNNKIKFVDPVTKICNTLCGPTACEITNASSLGYSAVFPPVELNEPGGICINPACDDLYIVDTNNHEIKVLNLSSGNITELLLRHSPITSTIECDSIRTRQAGVSPLTRRDKAQSLTVDTITSTVNQNLQLQLSVADIRLTDEAPSAWQLTASTAKYEGTSENLILIDSGVFVADKAEMNISVSIADLLSLLLVSRLTLGGSKQLPECISVTLTLEAILYSCTRDSKVCKMKEVVGNIPLKVTQHQGGISTISVPVSFSISKD